MHTCLTPDTFCRITNSKIDFLGKWKLVTDPVNCLLKTEFYNSEKLLLFCLLTVLKDQDHEAGEMSQQLRALDALTRDSGLVSSIHGSSRPAIIADPGDLTPSSGLHRHCMLVHMHTC